MSDSTFDLSFDSELDEFDPLEDTSEDENDDEGGDYTAISSATDAPAQQSEAKTDDRTPAERIDDLFKSMAPRRKVLLGILSFVQEPQTAEAVNAHVDELQQDNFSVYTAANLCNLLERAGAIERITADGQPADDTENEPKTVVVDGVEYLEAAEPVEVFWRITEPGQAKLDSDKPTERLRALLEEDAAYAVIYKRILTLCAAENGAATPVINGKVDNDPLVQKPRLYAPHFVDKLEQCDALEWRKAWFTTETGKQGLEMLADVVDESAADSKED